MSEEKRFITSKNASYEVIKPLGEGFAGEVFEVVDLKRGKNVALKLLKGGTIAEGQLASFKREFGFLTGFHHPHLCKVYDFGFSESESRHFFTVELIKGENLYAHTDKLPIDKIEEIFVEIADAIGFIHSAGLIHFDIKGGNILVTSIDGKPIAKIIDFGLAVPPVETHEDIVGTVRYMSPEMITREQAIDYRADLYSLGMVLYRMLAGRYPPQGTTMEEILTWHVKHTSIDASPLEERGAPKYLIDVVEKLLNPIPADRFSSAQVIIKYIELHSDRRYQKSQRRLLTTLTEEGPLVGRADLIYEIRSAVHKLSQGEAFDKGSAQILILAGPQGIGKSRMLKEARYLAQIAQANTVMIRGSEEGRDISQFASAIGISQGGEISPAKVAECILAQKKMFLMIDDLDECNQSVRDAVAGAANAVYSLRMSGKSEPIFILATLSSRGAEEKTVAPSLIGAKLEHLPPLTRDEIVEYQKSFLGESSPPPAQTDDILKFSGGIPELVRTAIASLESPTANLMRDANQFFKSHIDKLSIPAKKILCCMAIAEKALSHDQLEAALGFEADRAMAELIQTGLVAVTHKTGLYNLTASAIIGAAKNSLPETEMKTIAARLLKIAQGEKKPDIDAIAKFAAIGAEPSQTLDILIEASEEKEKTQEPGASRKYSEQALALMDEGDKRAPAIHRKMARHLILAGKYEEAIGHIEMASQNSSATVDDLISLSWIERLRHKPADALLYLEKAANLCGLEAVTALRLKLKNEMALCHLQLCNFGKAIEIFSETAGLAKRLPNEEQMQIKNNNLGMAYAMQGDFGKAVKFYKEKLARFACDKRLSSSILGQLAFAYEKSGKNEDAIECYRKSWEMASQAGDVHSAATILGNLINLCINRALFSDALSFAKESLKIASESSSEKDIASNLLTIGNLYINLGLEDIAKNYLNEAASVFDKLSDARMEGWTALSLAHLYNNTGNKGEASSLFKKVIETASSTGDFDLRLLGHHGMADMLLDAGNAPEAAPHIKELEGAGETRGTTMDKAIKIDILRFRFAFASEHGDKKTAVKRLSDLAETSAKCGFRELAGEAHYALSLCHKALGDEKMSARHISKAKEIMDDITNTLSEEYRDSFRKQKFREMVIEESVRLDRSIVTKLGLGKAKKEKGLPKDTAKAQVTDTTMELPSGKTSELPGKKA